MMAGSEGGEKLISSYLHLNSLLGKPLETQTAKDPKDSKKVPTTTLKPTFLCLQCATVSTRDERDAHCKLKKHQFCTYHPWLHSHMLIFGKRWKAVPVVYGVVNVTTTSTILNSKRYASAARSPPQVCLLHPLFSNTYPFSREEAQVLLDISSR